MRTSDGIARDRTLAWAVLAIGLLLAVVLLHAVGLSAQAARRGWTWSPVSHAALPAPSLIPLPTATPLPSSIAGAAPAQGTTGTIALPAPPTAALAGAPPADLGVVAAAPFRFGRAPPLDRARALECLTAAIYYEAASEPDAGQQAVAQVVLNRVSHPAFPSTVCGVVYEGSDHAGCQFSFACDGAIGRHRPSAVGWARAARTAAAALAGRVYAPVGLATHYHSYAVTPAWNRALVMTDAVGAHFFHRWKGWWGTPAAFRQLYVGGEPLPGPLASPAPTTPLIAGTAPVSPLPVTSLPAAVTPASRGSGTQSATVMPSDDHLPAGATVLPQWAESGRPLR